MKRIFPFIVLVTLLLCAATPVHKPTIFMMGDSTMANKKASAFPETGWGEAFYAFVDSSRINVDNHAKNGRSTKSFRDQGLWETMISQVQPGDYVFIQFGHNDEKSHKESVYAAAQTDYRQNLLDFVNGVREKGAQPVLFTSIVRRNFNEQGILVDTHQDYPQVVKEVGDSLDVEVIDMEALTRAYVQSLGEEPSKQLFMISTGKNDNTHLTRGGALKIASLAVDQLKKQLPELAIYF